MLETDPANLQPKVDRINHQVAEFVREYLPRELSSEDTKRALDILESPWPRREQNDLRKLFNTKDDPDQLKSLDFSRQLIEHILETGLEPSQSPDPLPPIEKDDVKLLCWLAIECEDDTDSPVS